MPKRRSSSSKRGAPWKLLGVLGAIALAVFLAGEAWAFLTSDLGRVLAWRWTGMGDRSALVRIVGKRVHEGLAAARVARGAVREEVVAQPGGGTPRWHVELRPDQSPTQVNFEVSRAVERGGAAVVSGRETSGGGAQVVTIQVGAPGRVLQELVISRPARVERDEAAAPAARVALVLYGFGDDDALASRVLARGETFAVAVPGNAPNRERLLRAARAGGHEVVLHVPMEPEKYPQGSPGPGTLLVNMSARRIEKAVRDELDAAGDVVAACNLAGSLATQDEPFMTAVYHELRRAGVPFLHMEPVPRSVCRTLAAQLGAAYDEPDATLNVEARMKTPAGLARTWKDVLEQAERRGHAIVLLRVTPLSAAWLDGALGPRGLGHATLVPLSSVIRRPDVR
jgi:polysaccharide deacetylase 2 family uncharacterized protein YibQ